MDAIKNLPAPIRIGGAVLLVVVLGALIWMMTSRKAPDVAVVTSQDVELYRTAQTILEQKQIPFTEQEKNGIFTLMVPADVATDSATMLAASGIQDRTGLAKKIECPAAPGFTANKATQERYSSCTSALEVQSALLTAGATAANVSVSVSASDEVFGPENVKNVVAQVFLPTAMKDRWNAAEAASAIKGIVGTSIERVTITDDRLQTLFDGQKSGAAATPGGMTSGNSTASTADCDAIADAQEIATKEAAIRSCYEATISQKLTAMLGGSSYFVLGVQAKVDSTARTTTTSTASNGAVVNKSTNSGSGGSATDTQSQPTTSEETAMDPAGDMSSLRLTVALDSKNVNAQQEIAVKRLLETYIDPERKDPAPTVTRYEFPQGTGKQPENEAMKSVQEQVQKNADANATVTGPPKSASTGMTMFVIGGIIVAVLLIAIGVLTRRASKLQAERERLEVEFRNDQRLFENFAQQNPNDIAADLESLFGAPSAGDRRTTV